MVKKAVVLLSGGLDSATVLALAREEGFETYALSFDYGQRHLHELKSAASVARHVGAVEHHVVKFDLRAFGGSALTSDIAVPKDRDAGEMRAWYSSDVCASAEHDFPFLRPGVGRSARLVGYLHRSECARLQRLPGLPAGVYRGLRTDGEPCDEGRSRRHAEAEDPCSADRDEQGGDHTRRARGWV